MGKKAKIRKRCSVAVLSVNKNQISLKAKCSEQKNKVKNAVQFESVPTKTVATTTPCVSIVTLQLPKYSTLS